ncbi:MAG: hypothetical protein JWM80_4312 [Cyanobacteria bacterium RYN_339]|nr:hypothetical protein [Cyanobacteria bacterium RYN_339]
MTRLIRALALAVAASGCTVVAPNLHVTSVSFPTVVANAPAASSEPWPSHGPASPDPIPTARAPRSFQGEGPSERVGPVHFDSGRAALHVQFQSAVAFNGDFTLELHDQAGRFVASLANGTGSFDRQLAPDVAITDDYYLAVTAADGRWTIQVN